MIGEKFNRLEIIERATNKGKASMWLCRCDCGKEKVIRLSHMKSGEIKSCGCLRKITNPRNAKKPRRWGINLKGKATNQAIHQYLNRNYSKSGVCSLCGKEGRTDYANLKQHDYSRDIKDYSEICRSCHVRLDLK